MRPRAALLSPCAQGIFPTQGLNPGLLHCRQILYQLSHKGSPVYIPQILLQEREWEPSALSLHQSGGLSREGLTALFVSEQMDTMLVF